jgi:HEAT repeat protein
MLGGVVMRRIALALLVLGSLVSCANRAKRSIDLYESGDYAGAARAADEGLASHPGDDNLWAMKVRASLALGDADAVASAYDRYAAQRGNDDKPLLRELATVTLAQALASPSVKMKVAAIEAIERIEIHALTDQVAELMGDDDDRVAAAAAVAVLRGMPGAPQVAHELMRSEDAEARRIAVDGVGRKVGKLASADLVKAADDPDPRVRRVAIRWLGMNADPAAQDVLARRLRDSDDSVRAAAASALARIGAGDLRGFAKHALDDRSLAVRMAAIELLAAAKADADLVALTDDADAMVALQAAIAVKITRPELAEKAIVRASAAAEWTTRAGAANLLVSALGREAARPHAAKLAADPELGVRLAAARVLAQLDDRDGAKRIFSSALTDAHHGVQAAADLAALGDKAGMQALSQAVRDASRTPEQRTAAASAHRLARRVTGGLVAALADVNGLVRVEAAAALGTLAKQRK